ncbi:hypothetical protein BDV96DRAFT_596275 [Lophiotrema nucula]|uniref:Uncharacterized protein n=1 Tax=Lophiotrema nucula TaxID=690887 RepID=A0A6A5ZM95_9PLEO|nr:hypothetical protein BDV96DRAFT_596275 [Lophiotrema nucula]
MSQPLPHTHMDGLWVWIDSELRPFLRQYFDRGQGENDNFDDEIGPIKKLLELLVHLDSHPTDMVQVLQAVTAPPGQQVFPAIGALAQNPRAIIALSIWFQMHRGGLTLRDHPHFRELPLSAEYLNPGGVRPRSGGIPGTSGSIGSPQPGVTCPRCGYTGTDNSSYSATPVPNPTFQGQPAQPSTGFEVPPTGFEVPPTYPPAYHQPELRRGRGGSAGSSNRTRRSRWSDRNRGRGGGGGGGLGGYDGTAEEYEPGNNRAAKGKAKDKKTKIGDRWAKIKDFFKRKSKGN